MNNFKLFYIFEFLQNLDLNGLINHLEIPTNEGCFKDDINSRAMKIAIENDLHMTIDKCYERCSSLNCTFMAVQVLSHLFHCQYFICE